MQDTGFGLLWRSDPEMSVYGKWLFPFRTLKKRMTLFTKEIMRL